MEMVGHICLILGISSGFEQRHELEEEHLL
jgi:hypothetical protein